MSDLNATQGADGAVNAAGGATTDAAPSSTEPAFPTDAGAVLEADAAKLLGDATNDAPVAAVAAVVAAIPLIVRVEKLARRAFDSGQTDEHNLMAWLHQHIDAMKRAIAGAPSLPLSDDAKALVDELKGLL
ncbi:hypothetical protein WK09_20095 [Burkholderia ubonensis]|uniref:hypothetical protein n=1 Tax=Burkholderia ubonensis TaxID=101571 RepID=UPI000758E910|nr:hypothetical protein [Burkholderia ubonensis]KVQ87342.1 hypothetical protein WK09_20095 [Burkholderia ubonensis]KWB89928.1 hypothetical protein WL43_07460 [Burkholderia ubonensis]